MMNRSHLDLYIDYLQVIQGSATATGLSRMVDGAVSHDQLTRLLTNNEFTSKDLWHEVKPLVRKHESGDACLIFDDTIIEKSYTDESALICWHYDHSKGRSIKGINLLMAFYHAQTVKEDLPLRVPIGYQTVRKTELVKDSKTGKEQRKSPVTKNEMLQGMIIQSIQNQLKFKYVIADSWFGSSENMRFIHQKKRFFIFDMKTNRLAALTDQDRNAGRFTRIDKLQLPLETSVKVWLKDLNIRVVMIKQIFKNKDSSTGERYLVSNDLGLNFDQFKTLYKKRWSVEEYHKSIKQNTAVANSPTRTIRTQSNHLFASILAYIRFEKLKLGTTINHFALKAKLYIVAIKAAYKELTHITKLYSETVIA